MSINDINEWCRNGNIQQLKRMHERGALIRNLNNSTGVYGYKPLHVAAAKNQRDVIEYLLSIDDPRNHIEGRASSNYTPLHLAVSFVNINCVEVLLSHNSDTEAKDIYGKTPLNIAIENDSKKIIIILKKERLNRTILIYIDIPPEDTAGKDGIHKQIRELMDDIRTNHKKDMEAAFKKAIEITLSKLKKMENPRITNGIDILGMIIITNRMVVYLDNIEFCSDAKNLYIFGWYLTLIRAINYDAKEVIHCLLNMKTITLQNSHIHPEFFPHIRKSKINDMIEYIKPNWESIKISLKFPIRIANAYNSHNVSQYLEWILPQHGISTWCVKHQCNPAQFIPEERDHSCDIITFVNWSHLKVAKLPPKVFEGPLPNVEKLSLSNNVLRCVPRQLIHFKSMQYLNLSYNNITTMIPCQLLALDSLKKLDFSHNQITNISPNQNEGSLLCQSLEKLILSHNNFREIRNDFSMPNLSLIDLSNNQLKNFPVFLSNSITLCELKLTKNPNLKSLPGFLGDFEHLNDIEIDLKNFSPALSVNTNRDNIARDIKKCLTGGRHINALKVFCIGDNESIKVDFLRRLMNERDFPRCDLDIPLHTFNWENASINGGNITIWNVRNKNIEVTSKVLKNISELRSVIYLVVDAEKGPGEHVKKWVTEIIKINDSYWKYDWISCVNVVTLGSAEKSITKSMKICEYDFTLYTESQIRQVREEICYNKYKSIVSFRENRINITIEEEMICSDYNQIYQSFLGLISKNKLSELRDPIVDKEKFIGYFKETPEYETVQLLETTGRIVELLKLLERFGLIVYLDEIRDTPIVLKPCALYNSLIKIVTEDLSYQKLGLFSMQKFITYIKTEPPSIIIFQNTYSYMLLLRKLNLIMVLSKQYFIVPSKLPSIQKEINIDHEFRPSWKTTPVEEDGIDYNHRIFLLKHMSREYCNELIADILYETPILSAIVTNKPMQPNDLIFNNKPSEKINPTIFSGIEPARSRAHSSDDFELVSNDNSRTVQVWKNNLLYVDSKNAIKLLVREYSGGNGKGIEIVTARDPLKLGDSFLFRVKTSIYQTFLGLDVVDLLAVPYKQLRDEKNPYLIDSFYKYANLRSNVRCCVSSGSISKEALMTFAPELSIDHSYNGMKFQNIPYQPNDLSTKLGGKNSCVYRGRFQNELVAVKEFRYDLGNSKLRVRHEMLKEAKLLSEYRHSCLINIIGVSSASLSRCFIVLKLAPFGELGSFLKKNNPLKPRILYFRFTQQIAAGLDFLHTHIKDVPLIHHDLKPENILVISDQVDAYVNVKIADLNMSKNRAGVDGTTGYRAPEIVSHHAMVTHDYKLDVYSFALVLVNLISHRIPFIHMNVADTSLTVRKLRPVLNWQYYFENGMVSLLPIIQACWNHQPQDRPDMKPVLNAVSSPSLQFLFSNRSLPTNSSYNPMASCAIRITEKKEHLCYAFSTTYEGSAFYTKICLYDVANNQITERSFEEFYRNKVLMQMHSHKYNVVLTLQGTNQKDELVCYMVQYSNFIGSEMNLVNRVELPRYIFLVQAMCIDDNRIYLALSTSIYIFKIDTLEEEAEIIVENDIQCMLSLGNELWVSTQPYLIEKIPSLKIRIFDKGELKQSFAIKEDMDNLTCIGQMVPTNQEKRDVHQAQQQVWCLDSSKPIVFIFDSGENKFSVGAIDLNKYLPDEAKYSHELGEKYNYKNTKICPSTNTMWISTQHGYIFIFSTGTQTQELIVTLNVFLGPIVFLTPIEIARGSMVACCGEDFVHPFYNCEEKNFYEILSSQSRDGNFNRSEEIKKLISNQRHNDRICEAPKKHNLPKKHDIVLWEAYNENIYRLVEMTKEGKFWKTEEAFSYSLSKEMLEAINLSDKDNYFLSETYRSHENAITL
ncbi:Leucine-rich repeat serine/threonine-protein kinase 1-like [Oopsacas minuta]|uniref:Leucine-rich repeat serine/threonine-protein kinase 1-like n=1 Tax=Oopsacas minuta TaxID=111878 RepID=A0AAV7JE34_9METZ|nr:Leucine-rich repeat serine/threonine-protein kinase 1-like [Oopsacas minuta]